MKTSLYSRRINLVLMITGLLLIELSYNTILFAAKAPKANLLIVNETKATTITHGTSVQTSCDGVDVITNATGTTIS